MPRTGRVHCCEPHCRRTVEAGDFRDWICSVHWPLVSAKTKRRRQLHRRFVRRALRRNPMVANYWKLRPGSPERIKAVRMWGLSRALWERCKREAIERAAGIS